jgi:hypothetical protein
MRSYGDPNRELETIELRTYVHVPQHSDQFVAIISNQDLLYLSKHLNHLGLPRHGIISSIT